MKVKVLNEFRDIDNFDYIHKVGDEIEVKDDRLKRLIDLGLVEKLSKQYKKKTEDNDIE